MRNTPSHDLPADCLCDQYHDRSCPNAIDTVSAQAVWAAGGSVKPE